MTGTTTKGHSIPAAGIQLEVLNGPGDGSINFDPPASITEGSTLSIAGSFSGPSDDIVHDWQVAWGWDNFQGTVTPLPADPNATSRPSFTGEYSDYAEPGTYQLAILVGYDENGQDHWQVSYASIAVTEATPTFTVSGASSVNVGDTYALGSDPSPDFVDPGGDAPLYYSIDWGEGLGYDTDRFFDHVYQSVPPGGVAHVTVKAVTEDGTYSATQDVTVTTSPPSNTTVSITDEHGAAYEKNQVPDWLASAVPLRLKKTVSGSLVSPVRLTSKCMSCW